jgi:hypothetical protein
MSLLLAPDWVAPMKLVYSLRSELLADPRRLERTQALTLDDRRPNVGLRGTYGLFGSDDWWHSIRTGRMPLLRLSGTVERVYASGQDQVDMNTVDIRLSDGSERSVGIYVNDSNDLPLFQVGRKIAIVYALDELKQQPAQDGGVNASKVALEMAVSLV